MKGKIMSGRFITFEGGEGAGKSYQSRLLVEKLKNKGITSILTREPGGTPGGEEIRNLLVKGSVDRWSPMTETMLFYAARADHLERVVRPALDNGWWVICDRFHDSTRAYQGAGGGVEGKFLSVLDEVVINGTVPERTIILDAPVSVGLERTLNREGNSAKERRFESNSLVFHNKLRDGFLKIADEHPDRCRVIDATLSKNEVAALVWNNIKDMF
jgi:dTMP kinase